MLKLIAKLLFAGALASSYSYVSYAQDDDAEEMEDEGGDAELDSTPGTDVKMAEPAEKPAPVEKAIPVAKVKAKAKAKPKAKLKAKAAGKNKKMAAKKY